MELLQDLETQDKIKNSKRECLNKIAILLAHQKIGLMEKISPIKLYTKV